MKSVKIYTTKVCPYCKLAKQLLEKKGVSEFEEILIDGDPKARDLMMELTNRRTVPQIFVGETHVGGFDDLSALNQTGKLDALLNN